MAAGALAHASIEKRVRKVNPLIWTGLPGRCSRVCRIFDLLSGHLGAGAFRIDPADMAVASAVHHVQLARCEVAEHQHLLVDEVHAHHGVADCEHINLRGLLGNHSGIGDVGLGAINLLGSTVRPILL